MSTSPFYKSSSSKVDLTYRYSRLLYGASPIVASGTYSYGSRSIASYRSGAYGKDWKKEIRLHRNAATGLSASRQAYHGGFGQHYNSFYALSNGQYIKNFEEEVGRIVYVNYPNAATSNGSAINEARMRLYKDANRKMRAFQALTSLGELRETLRMIRRPGKKLFEGMYDYMQTVTRRTRRAKKFRRPGIVSETWLEYVFGWAPLINDVRGAGEGLNRRLERYQGNYARVSGRGAETSYSYNPMISYNIGGHTTQRRWGCNTFSQVSVWYRGEVKSVCPNPVAADMRLFGATWSDVLPAAWELIPWSFVADYFTNIGDIIDSWSIRESDWAWLFSTTRHYARNTTCNLVNEVWEITDWPRYRPEKGYTTSLACSPARAIVSTVSRATPLSGGQNPSFRWELPGVGSQKWLNLAALGRNHKRLRNHVFH